jgi:ubiquinone/menaquinone biosynthesis C-methylase UbiE
VDLIPYVVHSRAVWRKDMPKTRFVIRVPGKTDVGCDTADQVLDALNNLKNAKGVTVADLQTGMNELSQEALEELANEERE